jgi:hypothetical protein
LDNLSPAQSSKKETPVESTTSESPLLPLNKQPKRWPQKKRVRKMRVPSLKGLRLKPPKVVGKIDLDKTSKKKLRKA